MKKIFFVLFFVICLFFQSYALGSSDPISYVSIRQDWDNARILSDTTSTGGLYVFAGGRFDGASKLKTVILYEKVGTGNFTEIQRSDNINKQSENYLINPPYYTGFTNHIQVQYKVVAITGSGTSSEDVSPQVTFEDSTDPIPYLQIEDKLDSSIIINGVYTKDVKINYGGIDMESGIYSISLYEKVNNGNWNQINQKNNIGVSGALVQYVAKVLPMSPGNTYSYKVQIIDNGGNFFESEEQRVIYLSSDITTCNTCQSIGGSLEISSDGTPLCKGSHSLPCDNTTGWQEISRTDDTQSCIFLSFGCRTIPGTKTCKKVDNCMDGNSYCSNIDGLDNPVPGSPFMCKVGRSSCPSGWTQNQNWTTTQSVHGWAPNYCTVTIACDTGQHGWSNTPQETCLYNWSTSLYGTCYYGALRAYANITQVGCTPPPDTVNPEVYLDVKRLGENLSLTSDSWSGTGLVVTAGGHHNGIGKLKTISLEESIDGGAFFEIANRDNIYIKGLTDVFLIPSQRRIAAVDKRRVKFRVTLTTGFGGIVRKESPTITFDTLAPLNSDISYLPVDGTDFLATGTKNFLITVSPNGGSPIVGIESYFSNYTSNTSGFGAKQIGYSGSFSFIGNTTLVDNNRFSGGYKPYYLWVNKVCDEAGNCLNNPSANKVEYKVYANSLDNPLITANSTNLVGGNVADGISQSLTYTLKDRYGNDIIPANGINRKIAFDIEANNNTYINQYTKTGGSSVFVSTPSNFLSYTEVFGRGITTPHFSEQPSSDGNYGFNFKVYTPVGNSPQSDRSSRFAINSATVNVTGDIGANSLTYNTPIEFNFRPLISTQILGDLKNDNFYEGKIQNSTLNVVKNSAVSLSQEHIYLEFGSGARLPVSGLVLKVATSGIPTQTVGSGHQSDVNSLSPSFLNSLDTNANALITKLTRLGGSTISNLQLYLSTHISYGLDGKSIVYNGDVLNKGAYWDDDTSSSGTTEFGVKIIGIATSTKKSEVVNGQFIKDITSLGNFDKATIKNDIISRIYTVTKNITTHNGAFQIVDLKDFSSGLNDGVSLVKNTVLYFGGLDGSTVTLGNGTEKVIGKKTLVIVGGNLYIKNDMYYEDKTRDMLGIVVLKDKNGKGGNVYIDPSVTNIVGTIVTDKSIISYDGTKELDGTHDFDVLKNQLHIFGSVLTENTLGGSRLNPVKCPYFERNCTAEIADKYDLNFLRRYNLGKNGLPIGGGKVIGGGICSLPTKTCAGGNTSFARVISNLDTDSNAKYSLVIEYNPLISKVYPPLFAK